MAYQVTMIDDIAHVMRGDEPIGRALTRKDGEALVLVLNQMSGDFRDRILAGVTDAIEECFEGVA